MKLPLLPLMTALCMSAPALAMAAPLQCPEPAPVFGEADAKPLDLKQLAQTVGTAELDDKSLYTVAQDIRADYPKAKDADVADIMITAYCNYLNTDTPPDHRSRATVNSFEKQTYNAVFGGTPPESYPRQGWLYND